MRSGRKGGGGVYRVSQVEEPPEVVGKNDRVGSGVVAYSVS